MAGAWDRLGRRADSNDHNPLRSGTDFEGEITQEALKSGGLISSLFGGIANLLGFGSLLDLLTPILGGTLNPVTIWTNIANTFIKPLGFFAELIGGLIPSSLLGFLDPSKITGLPSLFTNVLGFGKGLFESIFGGGSSTATTIEEAIEEAKIAMTTTVSPNNPAVVDLAGRVAVLENAAGGNTWFDGFDRSTLGIDWTLLNGALQFDMTGGSYDFIQSNSADIAHLRYDAEQYLTVKQYAQFRIREIEPGGAGIGIMGNSTGTVMVAVTIHDQAFTFTNNFIRIQTTTTGRNNLATQAEFELPGNWSVNDVVGIGYSDDTDTYIAFLNDIAVCDFPDPGGAIVPTTGRHQHLLLNTTSGFSSNRGPGIDNVIGYDWI